MQIQPFFVTIILYFGTELCVRVVFYTQTM